MSSFHDLNAPLFDDHAFPLMPVLNDFPLNIPISSGTDLPLGGENQLSPILKNLENDMLQTMENILPALTPELAPQLQSPVFGAEGPQETAESASKLSKFFKKLLRKSPKNTLNIIKVKKDVDLKTGIVKTKVDENVFQMQPDGHLKRLFRLKLASKPTHINSHASPLLSESGAERPLPLRDIHPLSEGVHPLSGGIHAPPLREFTPNLHHHKPTYHNAHFNHFNLHHTHHKRMRSFGFGMAIFFLIFALIYAGMRVHAYVQRKRASKEYMMVYNQENDSLAQINFNANADLSSV